MGDTDQNANLLRLIKRVQDAGYYLGVVVHGGTKYEDAVDEHKECTLLRHALFKAILDALSAAKEEGRREEREACAKECEAVVANEIKDECIGEYDAWASCCVSRIRARSVKP